MGATTFFNQVKGTNANELFTNAVHNAKCMYGNQGYTGTIAEKHEFVMSKKPKEFGPNAWINMVEDFDENDRENEYYFKLKRDFEIYDDKWGPALCVPTEDGFIFCGWASE